MPTEAYIRYIKQDCTALVWVKVTRAANDQPVEDAVVEITLLDQNDEPVNGQPWPVGIPHVAGGVYEGYLSELIEGEIEQPYVGKMSVVSPTDGVANLVIPIQFETNQGVSDGS